MQPEMKCAVCAQPARGFHFGAFTCEGCKSFFGRNAQKGSKLSCRAESKCDVRGPNRRTCKACRFQACLAAGMDAANSRFGRRSKYFKVSMVAAAQAPPLQSNFSNVNVQFLLLAAMYSSFVQNSLIPKQK